jgi:FkbM family methyltransferase
MRYPQAVRDALHKIGWDITRWPRRPDDSVMDWMLRSVIETLNINCVLDVGANKGQFGQLLRSMDYKGRIVSFEPSPTSFETVSRLATHDGSWLTRQVGLAAKPGTATLHMHDTSAFDSLHASLQKSELPDSIGAYPGYTGQGAVTVQLSTLAAEFAEAVSGINSPKVLLKSDTQGHDLEVIAGAQGISQQVAAVLVELSVQAIYEEQPYMTRVMDSLKDEGFVPVAFQPVTRSFDELHVVEFDGLFLRQPSEDV